MKHITTEVLVIGGGSTGTGVLRDLAMRGIKCVMVEKRDLAHGTTGRYHGLLHSGGRYVIKDPLAARECIQENQILRKIMPFCIEDTGGFFVSTPWDESSYADIFFTGCRTAGIPVEEISISQMLKEEPLLNPEISRCFRVPDASADSFLAAESNVLSAQNYGAQSLTYHEVRHLTTYGKQVTGAVCHDLVKDEDVQIQADIVVNASGAWAGKIAASVGVEVQIKPGKGTMVAINHRILNTVVNRCKMPSDGDIIVPAHTVAVIGTTDQQVNDADQFTIEAWEIQLMLDEGEKLVPGLRDMRLLRAWAGVRPLYQESTSVEGKTSRDITRAYVLLDHESRDGLTGLVSITSGKWTTYRLMAQATVDLVISKLGVNRPCRTHEEVLPQPGESTHTGYHWLGARLKTLESRSDYGKLICECELVEDADILHAIIQLGAKSIDDIRRDTRLGMGPCQGGFCTFRVAGMLHQHRDLPVEETNTALRDFLQERWKGLQPVLWGQQLRQERLDELIYLNVLNIPQLPGPEESRLASEPYASPQPEPIKLTEAFPVSSCESKPDNKAKKNLDVLVIGAGLAGLAATWSLSSAGFKVRCISKGWGSLYWSSGCVDVLSHDMNDFNTGGQPLRRTLEKFTQVYPLHPYAVGGLDRLEQALLSFQTLCSQWSYPLQACSKTDVLAENWLLPTALGTLRQTCLAPETMIAGDCREINPGKLFLLVGFPEYPDFNPEFAAANLVQQKIPAQAIWLQMPVLAERRFTTGRSLAQLFASQEFRQIIAASIKDRIGELAEKFKEIHIGFPAVFGYQPCLEIWEDLQSLLGCPVFEIPGLPPSLPGIRLHQILLNAIHKSGGQVFDGMLAVSADLDSKQIQAVFSESAARLQKHSAHEYILATGGILGGGFFLDPPGPIGRLLPREVIFDAPMNLDRQDPIISRSDLLRQTFLDPQGHDIFRAGLKVKADMRPVDTGDSLFLTNLTAVGTAISGADPIREHSLEGIALLSANIASENLSKTIPLFN